MSGDRGTQVDQATTTVPLGTLTVRECASCHRPLRPDARFCTACGTPARADAGVTVVEGAQPRARSAAREHTPRPSALHPAFGDAVPAAPVRRVLAYAVDAVAVGAVSGGVLAWTGSWLLTALVAAELVLGLLVWEARTGRTLGNTALGLRTAREETPWSVGPARAFLRGLVLTAGHAAAGLGQWLVVASGAFDRSGRAQAWHDRVGRAVVVDVRAHERALAALDADGEDAGRGRGARVAAGRGRAGSGQDGARPAVAGAGPAGAVAAGSVVPGSVPAGAGAPSAAGAGAVGAGASPVSADGTPGSGPGQPAGRRAARQAAQRAAQQAPTGVDGAGRATGSPAPGWVAPPGAAPVAGAATPPAGAGATPAPSAHAGGAGPVPGGPADHAPAPVAERPITTVTPARPVEPAAPARPREHQQQPAPYLVTLDTGQVMSVTGPGLIGRNPRPVPGERCDHVVVVEDPERSVSRTHARFGIDGGRFWVSDAGSGNGTTLRLPDGRVVPVPADERVPVPSGSTIQVGDRTVRIDAPGAPRPRG